LRDGDAELSNVPGDLLDEIRDKFKERDFAPGLWAPLGGSQINEAPVSGQEKARRDRIDNLHGQCMERFLSEDNQAMLAAIKEFEDDPELQLIYRGQWYEGALEILQQETIGGLPRAGYGELIAGAKLLEAAAIQKQKGGTDIKKNINEWSTSREVGENWGKDTVVLVAIILSVVSYKGLDITYQDEMESSERGLIMDSRTPLIAVAILSVAKTPSYAKQTNAS
jgi:hypothetical protein